MIEITQKPILPELIVNKVKTDGSGCVVTYIGSIRDCSHGKSVLSVEYEDVTGVAEERLGEIAHEISQKWQVEGVAICHRVGKLKVGDINFVVAIASAHRQEGFTACQYAVDQFKLKLPTHKTETYKNTSIWVEE